jgi:hypothetical protein
MRYILHSGGVTSFDIHNGNARKGGGVNRQTLKSLIRLGFIERTTMAGDAPGHLKYLEAHHLDTDQADQKHSVYNLSVAGILAYNYANLTLTLKESSNGG